jgi:hypothetical protein
MRGEESPQRVGLSRTRADRGDLVREPAGDEVRKQPAVRDAGDVDTARIDVVLRMRTVDQLRPVDQPAVDRSLDHVTGLG